MAVAPDDPYLVARQSWTRLDRQTVRAVRAAYHRATDALAARVERSPGLAAARREIVADLPIVRSGMTLETLGLLQRGIATTARDTSTAALSDQLKLGPLVGTAQMREKLQTTADASALAWISRVSKDGLRLSDRVWRSSERWDRDIRHTVEQGILTGQSARDLARDLRAFVALEAITPAQLAEARRRNIDPNPAWQTQRLARTEIAAAAREATIMTNQTNPFYRGVRWMTSERWGIARGALPVCEICRALARGKNQSGVWPRGEEPTQAATHPNCRCVLLPVYDPLDQVAERIGDWLERPESQPELEAWADWMRSPTPVIPTPVPAPVEAPPTELAAFAPSKWQAARLGTPSALLPQGHAFDAYPTNPSRCQVCRKTERPHLPGAALRTTPTPAITVSDLAAVRQPTPRAAAPARVLPLPEQWLDLATVRAANDYARRYLGVESDFAAGDLDIANRVLRDFTDLKRQGYALPPRIVVEDRGWSDRQVAGYRNTINTDASGRVWSEDEALAVYRRSVLWSDPDGFMRDAGNWFSSSDASHIIRHELGHKMHADAALQTYNTLFSGAEQYGGQWAAYTNKPLTLRKTLEEQVSGYAGTKPHEFVAEVFAGALAGKTYSPEILQLYKRLDGPRLPSAVTAPVPRARRAVDETLTAPKPEAGTFVAQSGQRIAVPTLTRVEDARPFDGTPVATTTTMGRKEFGDLTESIVMGYLQQVEGHANAKQANAERSNFPIDQVYTDRTGSTVVEVKGGNISNQRASQQWRLTIGEPSDEEKALMKRMTDAQKRAYNQRKQDEIIPRKLEEMRKIRQRTGQDVNARTITAVVNLDDRTADLYSFDGFHKRVGWTTAQAKSGFLGRFRF